MPNPNYIFANTINGNPLYADRAEHDADGNLISTTYATKAELPEGVPTVTSSDDGKVLQASYSGGTGSVSWVTPSGGGTTYAAGKGIDLSNDTVSVITGSGLSIGSNTLGSSSPALGYSSNIKGIKAKTRWSYYSASPVQLHVVLENIYDNTKYAVAKTPYTCKKLSSSYVLDVGDILPFSYDIADYDTYGGFDSVSDCNIYVTRVGSTEGLAPNGEQYIDASEYLLNVLYNLDVYVEKPLPSSTSGDSGKVLSVNSSGNAVWATPSGGTTYTAGNMISLASDAIAVSTTAGITDIQQVAALPASPVATVLYLIPEA